MKFENSIPQEHCPIFKIISSVGATLRQPIYVVGGYVRDYYLNRIKKYPDIDFVTLGSGIHVAKQVHKLMPNSSIAIYKQFGTALVKTELLELEFVGARKESYRRDSRKPIVENGTLEDDQLRRDFTINALSWSLNKEDYGALNDPFSGLEDLKKGIIRTPANPYTTFSDDPLRMMRAVRFASQFNFHIHEKTFEAISEIAPRLTIISKERIVEELNKIILSEKPSTGFTMLFKTGLLKEFLPEMANLHGVKEINDQRHKDNFWHTLQVLDNIAEVSGSLWLRWAAILHDIAKPPTQRFDEKVGWTFHGHDALGAKWTKQIFKRLGLPLDERMKYVQKLIRLHLRPIALVSNEVSDSAIRRLIFDAGEYLDDLMKLCRADITSKNKLKIDRFQKNFNRVEQKIIEVEKRDRIRNWKNPLTGEEIMEALNIGPGKTIGDIKEAVKEAILNGDIPNDPDTAFEFMMNNKDRFLE